MSRLGWIIFEKGTNLEEASTILEGSKIDGYELRLAPQTINTQRAKFITGDVNIPDRLQRDYEQIVKLANHLDQECGFTAGSGSEMIADRLVQTILPAITTPEVTDSSLPEITAPTDDSNAAETNTLQILQTKKSIDVFTEYLNFVHQYDYYSGTESLSPEDHSRYFDSNLDVLQNLFAHPNQLVMVARNGAKSWIAVSSSVSKTPNPEPLF